MFQDTGYTKSACSPGQRNHSSGSSLQFVGRAPPTPENQEGATTPAKPPRTSSRRPCHCPQRLRQLRNGGGGSLPSSPECLGGIDSDGQSTMSELDGDHRCRRHQRPERRLAQHSRIYLYLDQWTLTQM